jgi:hypothetical protein
VRFSNAGSKGKEGKEGVAAGDRVIASGMQRVRKDVTVDAEEMKDRPPAPKMPLVRLLADKK